MEFSGESESGHRRRRDFEQNGRQILEAADEAFTSLGVAVSIGEIAKRAGVAPATVYRHFPTRDALVLAVFELRIAVYSRAVERAQQTDDPGDAFRRTIHAIVELQSGDRSFREILGSFKTPPDDNAGMVQFVNMITSAMKNARKAGVIRDDVSDADLLLLLIATEGIARSAGGQSPAALRRLVDIALDGACNTRTELDGTSLDGVQLFEVNRT